MRHWMKLLTVVLSVTGLITVFGIGVSSCTHSTDEVDDISKSRAAELMNSGEAEQDYCEKRGWYGDGDCDTFCDREDPDCSGESGGKKDDGTEEDYDPCAGKACGASCTTCPPDDSDCVETQVLKYCQPDGTCSAEEPSCKGDGGDYDPCADKTCGERCSTCPPDDSDCVETAVVKYCQPDGTCSADQPSCGGGTEPPKHYDPCADKACGERCTKCPPNDSDCVETEVLKYCQPDGSCDSAQPSCS